jgi:putative transposase
VDDFTREALALVADISIGGRRVVRELDALIARRGRLAHGRAPIWPCRPQ